MHPTRLRLLLLFLVVGLANSCDRLPRSRPVASGPIFPFSLEFDGQPIPKRPDGYFDFTTRIHDHLRGETTPETNALIPLLSLYPPSKMDLLTWDPAYLQALGIPHGPQEIPALQRFGKSLQVDSEAADDKSLSFSRLPDCAAGWHAAPNSELWNWLDAQRDILDYFGQAMRRPHYFNPSIPERYLDLDEPSRFYRHPTLDFDIRTLGHATALRVGQSCTRGNYTQAWQDLKTTFAAARHLHRSATLSEIKHAMQMGDLASQSLEFFLGALPADWPHLREMAIELRTLRPNPQVRENFRTVFRLWNWDEIQSWHAYSAQGRSYPHFVPIRNPIPIDRLHWETMFRFSETWMSRYELAATIPDCSRRNAIWNQLNATLRQPRSIIDWMLTPTIHEPIPNYSRNSKVAAEQFMKIKWFGGLEFVNELFDAADRAEQQFELDQLALALAIYRAEHGSYPDSLAAMVPTILPRVPSDRFTGAPLKYQRTRWGYRCFSVGPDETDDGGAYFLPIRLLGSDLRREQPPRPASQTPRSDRLRYPRSVN
ncbi:hypothetical protein [Tuwongella immobilis]|uniref:Uncharacterized protein n=1 Tax=Tuwongella immobilis TaxID=692036 RepID=A0A6C2YJ02_9BACT|nr:hypothetical protein [Tuwongella immobilis]VIP01113.1 Uncharacterized protein OS=Blastopirellula marina DSM 3645 GN=DSM3645_12576 PE=4 SV=1 [Tuwongella immobilis]VTR97651.1 Uncharacterized protein OS=Blastopirellula marina DSM 3645 GN=DSM3645_12576 PE=4 SV=1 [Tuwongella immobilis]